MLEVIFRLLSDCQSAGQCLTYLHVSPLESADFMSTFNDFFLMVCFADCVYLVEFRQKHLGRGLVSGNTLPVKSF